MGNTSSKEPPVPQKLQESQKKITAKIENYET